METLLPFVCDADDDGITLYLFGDKLIKLGNVRDAARAQAALADYPPGGDSILAAPLDNAVRDHFANKRKHTSILVVTAGVIKDELDTAKVIVGASRAIKTHNDLSISFIQVVAEMCDGLVSGDARAQARWQQPWLGITT